ncbi:hypothetical protein NC651_010092 [Populus alba x Populus x berolinensis]|nr:hypothetical protein NC651_010092 [Populus alba x Populus x berolinensis]
MTLKVKVVIDGTRFPIELPNDATVQDLKEAVHRMFNFYAVENQELLFNGLLLPNYIKLETYEVVDDSEIILQIFFTVGIIGKNPVDGQYHRYEVRAHRSNTVQDLKLKLNMYHGLDITNMNLQMRPQSYLQDRTFLWANEISSSTDIYIV